MNLYIVETLDENRGNWLPLLHIQPCLDNGQAYEKLRKQEKVCPGKRFRVSRFVRV
jgi:hypothetical protein